MKFFSIFAVIAAAIAVVCATNADTNGARLARGLPPLPPRNMWTPVAAAKRSGPSGYPVCTSGAPLCCASVLSASSPSAKLIIQLLNIHVEADVTVGLTCSPLGSGTSCPSHKEPVCCEDNHFNGIIALVCISINIGH